jgi:hypothetical protein
LAVPPQLHPPPGGRRAHTPTYGLASVASTTGQPPSYYNPTRTPASLPALVLSPGDVGSKSAIYFPATSFGHPTCICGNLQGHNKPYTRYIYEHAINSLQGPKSTGETCEGRCQDKAHRIAPAHSRARRPALHPGTCSILHKTHWQKAHYQLRAHALHKSAPRTPGRPARPLEQEASCRIPIDNFT